MSGRAQALVEFALILPVLLVLAFAMIQLAELGVARLALEHAAAEGARAGALTNDDRVIRETITAAVAPLEAAAVGISIQPPQEQTPRSGDPRGALLVVELRYSLRPLALAPALGVRARAVRRIEWTP